MANTGDEYGAVLEALNEKMDRDVDNRGSGVETVVETWHNDDYTQWYRIWSDGWCEQGGYTNTVAGARTINLLKSYRDTNYMCSFCWVTSTANTNQMAVQNFSKNAATTSSFTLTTGLTISIQWKAEGYIA